MLIICRLLHWDTHISITNILYRQIARSRYLDLLHFSFTTCSFPRENHFCLFIRWTCCIKIHCHCIRSTCWHNCINTTQLSMRIILLEHFIIVAWDLLLLRLIQINDITIHHITRALLIDNLFLLGSRLVSKRLTHDLFSISSAYSSCCLSGLFLKWYLLLLSNRLVALLYPLKVIKDNILILLLGCCILSSANQVRLNDTDATAGWLWKCTSTIGRLGQIFFIVMIIINWKSSTIMATDMNISTRNSSLNIQIVADRYLLPAAQIFRFTDIDSLIRCGPSNLLNMFLITLHLSFRCL